MIKKILLSLGTLTSTAVPVVAVMSCSTTTIPKVTDDQSIKEQSIKEKIDNINYELTTKKNDFGHDYILKDTSYNALYDEMMKIPNTVAIALIANHKVYTDIVKIKKGEPIIEALDSSKFVFKRFMHEEMGAFINSFALRSAPDVYMHGTRTEKNYGDFYPLYYINHEFAQLGVSNYHLTGHEMLEISYDDK